MPIYGNRQRNKSSIYPFSARIEKGSEMDKLLTSILRSEGALGGAVKMEVIGDFLAYRGPARSPAPVPEVSYRISRQGKHGQVLWMTSKEPRRTTPVNILMQGTIGAGTHRVIGRFRTRRFGSGAGETGKVMLTGIEVVPGRRRGVTLQYNFAFDDGIGTITTCSGCAGPWRTHPYPPNVITGPYGQTMFLCPTCISERLKQGWQYCSMCGRLRNKKCSRHTLWHLHDNGKMTKNSYTCCEDCRSGVTNRASTCRFCKRNFDGHNVYALKEDNVYPEPYGGLRVRACALCLRKRNVPRCHSCGSHLWHQKKDGRWDSKRWDKKKTRFCLECQKETDRGNQELSACPSRPFWYALPGKEDQILAEQVLYAGQVSRVALTPGIPETVLYEANELLLKSLINTVGRQAPSSTFVDIGAFLDMSSKVRPTRQIESFYYKDQRVKIDKSVLEQIGNLFAAHRAKEEEFWVRLTSRWNKLPTFFWHTTSCWWSERQDSRCLMKAHGGFAMLIFENEKAARNWDTRYLLGRSVLLPHYRENEPGELERGGPRRFLLFNAYGYAERGLDSRNKHAQIFASLTGLKRRPVTVESRKDHGYFNNPDGDDNAWAFEAINSRWVKHTFNFEGFTCDCNTHDQDAARGTGGDNAAIDPFADDFNEEL